MKPKEAIKKPTKKITKTNTKQAISSQHHEVKIIEAKTVKINKGPLRLNEFIETNPSLWCIAWALLWRSFMLLLTLYISTILLVTFTSLVISNLFTLSI